MGGMLGVPQVRNSVVMKVCMKLMNGEGNTVRAAFSKLIPARVQCVGGTITRKVRKNDSEEEISVMEAQSPASIEAEAAGADASPTNS